MKMSKKALSAMIAVALSAAALPTAALAVNYRDVIVQSSDVLAKKSAAKSETLKAEEVSPESWFEIDETDGYIYKFNKDAEDFDGSNIVVPNTITSEDGETKIPVKGFKTTQKNSDGSYAAMEGSEAVTSIDVSACESFASIGDYAFAGNTSLTSFTFMPSLEESENEVYFTIGTSAFEGCTNLTSLNNPYFCTSIGEYAFSDCSSLSNNLVFGSCSSLGKNAFAYCTSLQSVTIETSNLSSIPSYCFFNCNNLQKFNSDTTGYADLNGIKDIGDLAFYNCTSLTNVNLNGCTSIGKEAFKNCSALETVTNWNTQNMPAIPNECFSNCNSLKYFNQDESSNIDFNLKGITSIGQNAFSSCQAITVDLTDCTSIGNKAFSECYNLTTVTNWNTQNMSAVPDMCFGGCSSLKYFNQDKDNNIDFNLKGITSIGQNAFSNCRAISVDLTDCTSIGICAFGWCEALTTVTNWNTQNIPAIPNECFSNCTSLKYFNQDKDNNIDFNLKGITKVGEYAFNRCSAITTIDLPDCTSIGIYAFGGCKALTTVTNWNTQNMPTIPNECFNGCSSLKYFNQDKDNNIDFNLKGITKIGYKAFGSCNAITTIDLTDCTSIGNYAFDACLDLTTVTNWDTQNIPAIPNGCFSNCNSLKYFNQDESNNIDFNLKGITKVGEYAFSECSALTTVDLTDCTSIGEKAFNNCYILKEATISTNTSSVGENAFYYDSDNPYYHGVYYVTISADSKDDLATYCNKITSDGDLKGLYSIPKMAQISGEEYKMPDGLSCDLTAVMKNLENLSTDSTYYLKAEKTDDQTVSGGEAVSSSYKITVNSIGNGTNVASTVACNDLPVTVTLNSYDSGSEYYLAVDGVKQSNKIETFNTADGVTTATALSSIAENGSTVSVVKAAEAGMFEYVVNSDGTSVSITGINVDSKEFADNVVDSTVKIPATLADKPVTGIGYESDRNYNHVAGADSDKIKAIDFSGATNLTTIYSYAFRNCTNIETVTFPPSAYTIGMFAFDGTSITSVDLTNCTKQNGAFNSCPELESVIYPVGKINVEEKYGGTIVIGFVNCPKLKYFNRIEDKENPENNVDFNLSGVKYIASGFLCCTGITGEVDLTDCAYIDDASFAGCTNMIPVISTEITKVGESVFNNYESVNAGFCEGPAYVIIEATDYDDLTEFCSGIISEATYEDGDLCGLYPITKIGVIDGELVSADPAAIYDIVNKPADEDGDGEKEPDENPDENPEENTDEDGNIEGSDDDEPSMRTEAMPTYYLSSTENSDSTAPTGYQMLNAYNVSLNCLNNGASQIASPTSAKDLKVTVNIAPESYSEANKYYISVGNAVTEATVTVEKDADETVTGVSATAAVSLDASNNVLSVLSKQAPKSVGMFYVEDIDDENTAIIGFNTDSQEFKECEGKVEVPATLDGKTVTKLVNKNVYYDTETNEVDYFKSGHMDGAEEVIELDLSEATGLTYIDDMAFGFDNTDEQNTEVIPCKIKSVKFPKGDNVSYTIGESAFLRIDNDNQEYDLETVDLTGCTAIGERCFEGTSLTSVTGATSITTIPAYAFKDCNLESFNKTIGGVNDFSGIKTINDSAFYLNYDGNSDTYDDPIGLKGAVDLSDCTYIGPNAFNCNFQITSVIFPTAEGANYEIESNAFAYCTGITESIDLKNCAFVGKNAFSNCINIPGNIDLSSCKNKTDENGNEINGVERSAFESCNNIESVTWPSSVTTVPKSCFEYCYNLKYFNRIEDKEHTENNVDFNLTGIKEIERQAFSSTGISGKIDLSSCESIGNTAFAICPELTDVVWPVNTEGMDTIPAYCFAYDEKLKSFNQNDNTDFDLSGIKNIKEMAFTDCIGIQEADLTDCTSIGYGAFAGCTNAKPVISTKATQVLEGAFDKFESFDKTNTYDGPDYVTIVADSEDDLKNYCYAIPSETTTNEVEGYKLVGLQDIKKVGVLGDVGVCIDSKNITEASLADASTSYISYKENSDFVKDESFITVAAYTLNFNKIADASKEATTVEGAANIPVKFTLSSASYNPNKKYYLSTDTTQPVEFTKDASGNYYTLSTVASFPCDLAILTKEAFPESITVTGSSTVTYGTKPEFTASILPAEASASEVVWASSDEEILTFENKNSGIATIKGVTDENNNVTVTASTMGETDMITSAPFEVTVEKATPTAISFDGTDISVDYTGSPVEIPQDNFTVTLADGGTYDGEIKYEYYTDSEATEATEQPTDAGTYYVKPYIPTNQDNYDNAETISFTENAIKLTINSIDITGVTAEDVNVPYDKDEHSITVSGAPESTTVYYFEGDYETENYTDEDWKTENPTYTDVGEHTVSYKVSDGEKNYHDFLGKATVTITATDMPDKDDITAKGYDDVYDGQAHGIEVTGYDKDMQVQYYDGDYSTAGNPKWVDSLTFIDVCNKTVSYKVYDPQGNYAPCYGTSTVNISQAEFGAQAPAPQKQSQGATSITLETFEGGTTEQGDAYIAQYGIENNGEITWQSSPTFDGLAYKQNYNFYTRYQIASANKVADYVNNGAGPQTGPASFSVEKPAEGEGFEIDYENRIITVLPGYEASTDENFTNKIESGSSVTPGSTIYIKVTGADDYTANTLPEAPAAPAVPTVRQSFKSLTVTNGAENQEYLFEKKSTDLTGSQSGWQDSETYTDLNMENGNTYTVSTRVKATSSTFASDIVSTEYTVEANATPDTDNSVTIKGEVDANGKETWTPSSGVYDNGYNIPMKFGTLGGKTYMVEINWGKMEFTYNFGQWDPDTLDYDSEDQKGWGSSFDGTNNQINVINRSSAPVDSTITLSYKDEATETELNELGLHLATQNVNDTNHNYGTEPVTLKSGSVDNTTVAYLNIKADDVEPSDAIANKYQAAKEDPGTEIGQITVTIQAHNDTDNGN